MAYIDTTPIVENTTMQIYVNSQGVQRQYIIQAADDYVLHDNRLDQPSMEDESIIVQGYTPARVSVPLTYDFNANPFELFIRLATEVPSDQIFGTPTKAETV